VALRNKKPIYNLFLDGVENGLKTLLCITPALVAILSVSSMLRTSGLLDSIVKLFSTPAKAVGIPPEILPLCLLRPFSGGGSIGLLTDIIKTYGADSQIAYTACILCASTETTFYTISVYFRGTTVKYTKRVILAAVFGDLVGILVASLLSMIFF